MAEQLAEDPGWFQDEYGFYECYSDAELRRMSDRELLHIKTGINEKNAAFAQQELERRSVVSEHRLNIRDNVIAFILGGLCTWLGQSLYNYFLGTK